MKIRWLGHSCFKITNSKDVSVVTDPFDNTVGYKIPNVTADIVTTSHNHFDHNFTEAIEGEFDLVNKSGEFYLKDIRITGVLSHHDKSQGKKRGTNTIYTFDMDDIKVCHLGDLGHVLDDNQVAQIAGVDVLLIPVGGNFTIDAKEAVHVVEQFKPSIIIPMHFKTPVMNFPIDTVDVFLQKIGGGEKVNSNEIEIKKEQLYGQRQVYILNYE